MNILYIAGVETQSIVMLAVLGVLMVLMLVMSIVPQKKRQKEAQKMMESLSAGTKVKTIGGFIGEIKSIDGATIVIDLSPNCDGSNLCVLDKSAIYTVMQVGANGQVEEVKQEPAKALDDIEDEKAKAAKTEEKAETAEKAKDEKIF